VGVEEADDGGVIRLGPDVALVQSVDFMTPIVDDPYAFGAIAAANALSDLYAMGARPLCALNVCAFPSTGVPEPMLAALLQGACDKLQQAGAYLLGGHTVEDRELKFGLAVTGLVHPDRILGRAGARPGDLLVLTKPIGGGVVSTALKGGAAGDEDVEEMVAVMSRLNDLVDLLQACQVHACTDVTGFGLAGHALALARRSQVALRLYVGQVPLLRSARRLAASGWVPGGTRRNQQALQEAVRFHPQVEDVDRVLLCDAMTSGGLLVAVAPEKVEALLAGLAERDTPARAVVGEVVAADPGTVQVLP